MNPITVAATLLVVALAGCVSPDALVPPSESTHDSISQEPARQAVPGGAILEYSGDLEADACTVSDHANTCQPHTRVASTPAPHVSWHEIPIDAADELSIEADWTWHESGHATFYVWLICQDQDHDPCMASDGTVAYAASAEPVISIPELDFQAFKADHRLWVYFGVEPETNAAGEHYPRVNVDYTLKVQVEDAT